MPNVEPIGIPPSMTGVLAWITVPSGWWVVPYCI
jgi:hypothetical protein